MATGPTESEAAPPTGEAARRGWRRIGDVYAEAAELEGEERDLFVARAFPDDPDARAEVERLLAAEERAEAGGFLGEPLVQVGRMLDEITGEDGDDAGSSREERLPERIGPYRVLGVLGRGGMGVVYLARREDDDYGREVALKVVRRGFDTDVARRRFRAERQILARLEHPHVARLYDGGTTEDGRPYLVMERVEGEPITAYCDRRRLPLGERLELFLDVCSAVAAAHRHLLVHRDLKPGNILVSDDAETGGGVVKLLDFGIAKPLRPGALPVAVTTLPGERLLTPGYASPEQVRGEESTTQGDVYALGVLLYELLTGRLPHPAAGRSLHEVERAVLEGEVEPPSTAVVREPREADEPTATDVASRRSASLPELRRRLRGDLDVIVETALHKDIARRYPSALHLADDVRRHLAEEPVSARPDTLAYRTAKFLRRYRRGVVAATLVTVLVVSMVTWFLVSTVRQSRRLAAQRAQAELVSDFLVDLFGLMGDDGSLASLSASELLALGSARMSEALFREPEARVRLLDAMARVHLEMGLEREAAELAEFALELQDLAGLEEEPELSLRVLHTLAAVAARQGRFDEAESGLREILTIRRRILEADHPDLADTLADLGRVVWSRGDLGGAEALLGEALEMRVRRMEAPDRWVVESYRDLAALNQAQGDVDAARRHLDLAVDAVGKGFIVGVDQALLSNDLGALLAELGRYRDAAALHGAAIGVATELVGPDHGVVWTGQALLARSLEGLGHYGEAIERFDRILDRQVRVHGPEAAELAPALDDLARALLLAGRTERSATLAERSLRLRRTARGDEHPDMAVALYRLGQVRRAEGALDEAEAHFDEAEAVLRASGAEGHPALAYLDLARARLALDRGLFEGAEALAAGARAHLARVFAADHWRNGAAEALHGEALVAGGRVDEGAVLLRDGYRRIVAQRSRRDPRAVRAAEVLTAAGLEVPEVRGPEPLDPGPIVSGLPSAD